jgi:hypothetical protein
MPVILARVTLSPEKKQTGEEIPRPLDRFVGE